ncbi:MAG TPA: alanine racemase [Candidatus Paceibacterota bacterium]|nr:alanine racemase [Candidatus Paceibacterota bacterium]
MNILTWASRKRFPYEPLIKVEISKNHLIHNLHEFRKLAPKDSSGFALVAPVLKSNAYGHGMCEIAQILQHEQHIPFCIVDSYFEAIALRAKGFALPLLIIGYTRPETIRSSNLTDVAFTITSLDTLRIIAEQKTERWPSTEGRLGFRSPNFRFRPKLVHIHLKIDTGMNRQGILPSEVEEAINLIQHDSAGKRPVVLEGICSHLSDADNADETFTESQTHLWNKIVERFRHDFKTLKYIHLAATDGHRFTHDIAANVSRLGIGLYGLSENEQLNRKLALMPVLEMKTIITGIKHIKEGDTVGYGNTFKAQKDMTIATIPVGYYEGIDRRLSNIGSILVGLQRAPCPIIGRVSMNIVIIDVSKMHDLKIGDEVVAISGKSTDENSVVGMAKKCGTISYEIAVHIPAQLKRVVV